MASLNFRRLRRERRKEKFEVRNSKQIQNFNKIYATEGVSDRENILKK
jgi:hypothetical protein